MTAYDSCPSPRSIWTISTSNLQLLLGLHQLLSDVACQQARTSTPAVMTRTYSNSCRSLACGLLSSRVPTFVDAKCYIRQCIREAKEGRKIYSPLAASKADRME